MRVLYNNKLVDATITGTANANFGLGNLLVSSLSIPYVATDQTVELTIVFDAVTPVTCIAFAGHNLENFKYRMYDASNVLTEEVLLVQLDPTEVIYPTVQTAKKIILNLYAPVGSTASMGHLSIGEYLQMPNPNAYYDEALVMTNEREESAFGQVYGSNGVFLQTYAPDFSHVELNKFNEIVAMCEQIRNFHPIFVDMTEHNHAYKKPLYATVTGSEFVNKRDTRGYQRRSFSLAIKEVR